MLKLYITKVLKDALLYFDELEVKIKKRINQNQDSDKKKQMITTEKLFKYALKDIGFNEEIIVEYSPKPVLKNSSLSISKAHSFDYCLVAISSSNVGADIEKIRDIKNLEKLLAKEELIDYNKALNEKKKAVFTKYWTAKEAYIKYYGSLTKNYKKIYFKIDKTLNNFSGGKIDDLYCYQSFFNGYSFAVVSELFTYPEVIFVSEKEIKG